MLNAESESQETADWELETGYRELEAGQSKASRRLLPAGGGELCYERGRARQMMR